MIVNGLTLLALLPLAVLGALEVARAMYGAPVDPDPEYSRLDKLDGLGR